MGKSNPSKGIIYYSDGRLSDKLNHLVHSRLKDTGLPIVSCNLKSLGLGKETVINEPRGYLTMFKQILVALEASTEDIIFHAEHDVLYPKEHFDFTPLSKDKFYYDLNWFKVRKDGLAVHWDAAQVSGLCYYRQLGIDFYKDRVAQFEAGTFDRKFEPTVDAGYETWWATVPHIDIRGEWNVTYNKWKLEHFRNKATAVNFQSSTVDKITGWGDLRKLLE